MNQNQSDTLLSTPPDYADWATRVMIDLMPCIIPGCNSMEDRALATEAWGILENVLELHTEITAIQPGCKESLIAVLQRFCEKHPDKKLLFFGVGKAFDQMIYKPLVREVDPYAVRVPEVVGH